MLWNLMKARTELKHLIIYGSAAHCWDQVSREPYRVAGSNPKARIVVSLITHNSDPFSGIWNIESVIARRVTAMFDQATISYTQVDILKVF